MIFDQPDSDYVNDGTISGGVVFAAPGVRLTNSDSGRLYGGVTFDVGGSTLINLLGGVIKLSQFDQTIPQLVIGSDGADTVVNAGLISGTIALGGGADIYVDRDGGDFGIDLGAGDDVYRREGTQALFLRAVGGEGRDRMVLAGTSGQYWGPQLSGFEDLTIEAGGNFVEFSGFQTVTLAPALAPGEYYPFANLIDSFNPAVDIVLSGQELMLHNSLLRSITGSAAAERVELNPTSSITGAIALGGGDDRLTLGSHVSAGNPVITVPVDGGGGSDTLALRWFAAGDRSYDFSSLQGFEKLDINTGFSGMDPSTARLANLSSLIDIDLGDKVTLILSNSVSPNARVGFGFGGGLTLEAGSVFGRYGFPDGLWDHRLDIAQGDPSLSTTIINRGTIKGEVRFYTGDDTYDGRTGSVGGTIYGNAGNDTLLGGAGAETMQGGAGRDTLDGGAGFDTAIYTGLFRAYAVSVDGGAGTVSGAGEGTDTLNSIEVVRFRDGKLVFDADGAAAQVTRLYDAVLQRAPDQVGLDYYCDFLEDQGGTLKQVATGFLNSPEFQAGTGNLSNADYVEFLYQNALGRASDPGGKAAWVQHLDSGAGDRADLLIGFSESLEHRGLTADLVSQGFFNTDDDYQAIALLYDTFAGRRPDAAGLVYYADLIKSGALTLGQIADYFANSPEFRRLTDAMSNTQLINFMYENTLERPADAAGLAYWNGRLNAGIDRGDMLLGFSQSPEHFVLLGNQVTNGIDYL